MTDLHGGAVRLARLAALLLLASFAVTTSANTKTVQIAGPQGPLAGELIGHTREAKHIIVIIPGSGPIDRNGNAPQLGLRSDTYKLLAEGLARAGIASLRIDKRGMHGSRQAIPDPNNVTIAKYAEDVRDWVKLASRHARCVWLAGHSEGGLVALVSAIRYPQKAICGLILMATPGRKIGTLLRSQFAANAANQSLMPEIEETIASLERGKAVDETTMHPGLRPVFNQSLQPYLMDLFSYDPAALARQWHGPVLTLQGDADIQVSLKDQDALADALPQARRKILPRGTHLMKRDVSGAPLATYQDPSIPLHQDVLPTIQQFLNKNSR